MIAVLASRWESNKSLYGILVPGGKAPPYFMYFGLR